MPAPFVAESLRQDVLDRQIALLEVDLLRVAVTLLKSFKDELALRAAAGEVERPGSDRLTKLSVSGPMTPLARQLAPQRLREALILREMLDELHEQPV